MSYSVRCDIFINMRFFGIIFDYFPKSLPCHGLTVHICKQFMRVAVDNYNIPDVGAIILKRFYSLRIHGYNTLALFGVQMKNAYLQIDICDLDIDKLRYLDTGGIEHFEHRFVTAAFKFTAVRLGQKQCYFPGSKYLRQLSDVFSCFDTGNGIILAKPHRA